MMKVTGLSIVLVVCTALVGCAQHQRPEEADPSRAEARYDSAPTSRESPAAAAAAPSHMEPRSESETTSASGSELIGKRCRVRFRRDVLGVAGQAFVEPAADSAAPGRPLYVEGTVQSVTREAV